jgi:hypothetical protein
MSAILDTLFSLLSHIATMLIPGIGLESRNFIIENVFIISGRGTPTTAISRYNAGDILIKQLNLWFAIN